jgi:hypothetical protein
LPSRNSTMRSRTGCVSRRRNRSSRLLRVREPAPTLSDQAQTVTRPDIPSGRQVRLPYIYTGRRRAQGGRFVASPRSSNACHWFAFVPCRAASKQQPTGHPVRLSRESSMPLNRGQAWRFRKASSLAPKPALKMQVRAHPPLFPRRKLRPRFLRLLAFQRMLGRGAPRRRERRR